MMRNFTSVNKKREGNELIYFLYGNFFFYCKAQELILVHPLIILWPQNIQSIIQRNNAEPCCNLSAPVVPSLQSLALHRENRWTLTVKEVNNQTTDRSSINNVERRTTNNLLVALNILEKVQQLLRQTLQLRCGVYFTA